MAGSTPASGDDFVARGVNVIVDNTADENARQFLVCDPSDLIVARGNSAGKDSLQCVGQILNPTIEKLSRDSSQNAEAAIDVREVDSSTTFRGTGRTLNTIEGANSDERLQ